MVLFCWEKNFSANAKKHKWGWNELKLDPCNQYRGKKQWFITTNDADLLYKHTLSPDGDHPLGTAGYCHHVGLKYISAWRFFLLLQVKLESIGAEDIVDGNERLILAVIWMIILRFQIADISYEVLFINSSSILWKNQQ